MAAAAAIWWLAIRMLWNEWELDPQYSYGFLVPILCLALFFQRWQDRPTPNPPRNLRSLAAIAFPAFVFLAAVQPFFEANPEWRVSGILGAFSAALLTILFIYGVGGSPWMRHFLFPVCFFLVAIPWPRNAEEAVMGFLMEKNTMAALEILHWFGHEAVRRGHLITLPTGTLGVEEACSGVRSLQSGIMSAFFLGEIFRFSIFVRCGLVFSSVLLALFGNFARATTLSLIASSEGVAAIEKWHDVAGYAILLTTIGSLWVISYCHYRSRYSKLTKSQGGKEIPHEPLHIPKPIRFACLAVLATTAISLAGTEIWYRSHEKIQTSENHWTIQSGTAGTRPVPISDRTRRILYYPEGFSERFLDTGGRNWQFFYLRWPAGRTAIQALNIHDPRTCLASIGMLLDRQLPSITIPVGAQTFRFRVFLFRDEGRPVLVFHSIIAGGLDASNDSRSAETLVDENYTLQGRWNVVRKGIRNRGQSLIEAAVWNTTDVSLAANELTKFLSHVMVVPSSAQQ